MMNVRLRRYLRRVTKEVSGPSSYPAGGFIVDIGELSKVVRASVKYIGNGEYIAQILTKNQDDTLNPNQVKVFVRNNIEQAVNEGGSETYTIGGEIAEGTDISGERFLIEAEGY